MREELMMKTMIWLAAVLIAVPVGAQEVERLSGRSVAVYNIAGHVEVVRGSGSDVVVRIDRGGSDASALRVETGDIRGRSTLRIIYPDDEIVYPEMGRGSNTSMSVRADGTFSDGGRGRDDRVRVSGRGNGLEAWADLVIEVPSGSDFAIYLAVGEVQADGIDGDVSIDTGSGAVRATDVSGALEIDTGSGSVVVEGVDGDLMVDTGSGRVEVSDVRGREIAIDTGSGSVKGYGLAADVVGVDTGSGSIDLESVSARDVVLDTGSGSIDVELMTDVDRLDADTGSGSITVRAPEGLGAEVDIETGSGGIDLDFPLEVRSVRRDHIQGTIGDGRGEINIDTGSGSVKLLRGRSGPIR
jgi:lia operon protein LiaG